MSTGDDVVHVGSTDEYTGTDDLTIAASITIDTDKMMFGMPLPPGVTFGAAKQDGGGPDLAILHVRALAVHATVQALGSRPLVVIADSIELTETIDVTAHQGQPGPGALSAPVPAAAPKRRRAMPRMARMARSGPRSRPAVRPAAPTARGVATAPRRPRRRRPAHPARRPASRSASRPATGVAVAAAWGRSSCSTGRA